MPSFLFFFLFVSVLRQTSFAQTQTKQDREYYEACVNSRNFSCGDNTFEISYPFLVDGRDSICGDPRYNLTCSDDNNTIISIDSTDYLVKNISYDPDALTVAPMTTINTSDRNCSRLFRNTTLDWNLFSYTDQTVNLTLYSCPSSIPSTNPGNEITCSENSTTWLYTTEIFFSDADIPTLCTSTITVAVLRTAADNFSEGWNWDSFDSALTGGFQVNWNAGSCSSCMESGGACGYNYTSSNETCYNRPPGHGGLTPWQIVLIALSSVLGFVLIVAVCFKCFRRRVGNKIIIRQTSSKRKSFMKTIAFSWNRFTYNNDADDLESNSSPYLNPPHIFTYKELEDATDGFHSDREIGDGGFGTVYKGFLRDGRTVAVKLLYENNHKRLEQFLNEVKIVEPLRHPNLVTLYGCTSHHSRELLLVYEFVCNGTIADHLHGPRADERALTWPLRMKIAFEAADALAHLHAIDPPIIHRDVKTTNILLDNSFNVKVADFGLSRLFPLDVTHVSTAPQGTPGYVDPEYYQCYQLTDKSDVYSMGVVLVELISSKPAVDIARRRQDINLSRMAIDRIPKGLVHELADPELGYETDPEVKKQIEAVAEVAFLCLQSDKDMRPPMKVVKMMLSDIANERGDCKDKKYIVGDGDDEKHVRLEGPISPDTVTSKWYSRATTPNTSA